MYSFLLAEEFIFVNYICSPDTKGATYSEEKLRIYIYIYAGNYLLLYRLWIFLKRKN